MKIKYLLLILLISISGCGTTSKAIVDTTEARETVKDSKLTKPEKAVINNTLNQCEAQSKYVKELEERLRQCSEDKENINAQLAEASRDAGYKDMFHFAVGTAITFLLIGLVFAVLYLVATGKIRIPFLLGGS